MKSVFRIKTFNKIAPIGLERFPRATYEVSGEMPNACAIMLRSHKVTTLFLAIISGLFD
jgi:hypothetical protein